MGELDKILQHRSPFKPEVNYDMTKEPPAPIMDSGMDTKAHDWLPGFIKKWWEELGVAGVLAGILYMLITKRPPPVLSPAL